MQDWLSTLKSEHAKIARFKLYPWIKLCKGQSKQKQTVSAVEFERAKKGYAIDFVTYLYVKCNVYKPKTYLIILRNPNDMNEIKVTSCIVFHGKFVIAPELLQTASGEHKIFKRFSTRNAIFDYILYSLTPYIGEMVFEGVYEYIPKNKSFALESLIQSILNTGKRLQYTYHKELISDDCDAT